MEKYRVRKGWFGKSVLQVLIVPSGIKPQDPYWKDVPYKSAPRSLGSYDEYIFKIKDLEIEIASIEK